MFLALGYPEGLSLPPLEAMKSGCIVLGYSGYGGLEYMRDVKDEHFDNWNMDLYPDGDILNLSKAIFETWNILKDKGLIDSYQEIANNAVETANKWNEAATEKMLLEYLKGL
jgi:glycosyltransferase involved in cell wall biosynthesis